MIGKLKESCNKFIENKFPKSVINYRNVNNHIISTKMRNNSTCDTQVILITAALLLRSDI